MNEDILLNIEAHNKSIEQLINLVDIMGYENTCKEVIYKIRTLIEYIAVYHYGISNNIEVRVDYDTIKKKALPYIKKEKQLLFLSKIHFFVQASASHYIIEEETSPRLFLKYLPYLIKMHKWFYKIYKIQILSNINKLYKEKDEELAEYYKEISSLFSVSFVSHKNFKTRYYVYRCIPIYVNNDIIYELTLVPASDFASKFNRFVAFSNFEMKVNYSIQLNFVEKTINIKNMTIPVRIITNYIVSIRPCEFNNLAKLLGLNVNITSNLIEYKNLMAYLTVESDTLVDVVQKSPELFKQFKETILIGAEAKNIIKVLEEARKAIIERKFGHNVILYLLYRMNNRVIKLQRSTNANYHDLYIHTSTSPFDSNPYAMNLRKHQTQLSDLIEIFDVKNKECQLLYRYIKNKTEFESKLYLEISELKYTEEEILKQMGEINKRLTWDEKILLRRMGDKLYIDEYESTTKRIIDKLICLTQSGMQNYNEYVTNIISSTNILIDSDEKRKVLDNLFSSTHLAIIYGPAGTGKSFLAKHISRIFNHNRKIYLAATHPAVNNLFRKIGEARENFMTVASYNSKPIDTDILFIDECSTVSNEDMIKVLDNHRFKYLVLLGDVCQIQSIKYGPWFKYAKALLPRNSKFELRELHRTSSKNLEELWELVRNRDDRIEESLLQNKFVKNIDNSDMLDIEEDQIVLCLNYDGLYGINNMNRLLQSRNSNAEHNINDYIYKVNDPILFTENNQYSKILYNNLKGKIINIEYAHQYVKFSLNVERVFNEFDLEEYEDINLIKNNSDGTSDISIIVDKEIDSDFDESKSRLVPFQIAYAISIHKAQGLEYKNVKVIVSNIVFERITHDIFYTAITRATENLKIFWSEHTEKDVIRNICNIPSTNDIGIFANKFGFRIKDNDFNK